MTKHYNTTIIMLPPFINTFRPLERFYLVIPDIISYFDVFKKRTRLQERWLSFITQCYEHLSSSLSQPIFSQLVN